MNSERTAQLQVALASYDLKELRVQKRYLQEQGTAIDCTCFCSGEKLLAQLRQGVRYDAVVLCSELTDLPAEQFVRQFYQLKERPMLLIQSHGRSSGTALQKLREGCYCVEGTELKRLLWQLYRMPGRQNRQLEQHFDRTGADESTRQAVADIDTAAIQLDRTLTEAITLLEFLREDTKPQLYPIDLCELLQQVAAQSDMIRAQLGVDIRLDYGGCTACCVMADRRDAELLCLHLLSNALHASREGGSVCIALRRTESGWQLTVTDDGCGLPGEDVQAALENRRSFLGGAQLGLLLCRECCRRMDWSLQLEPAPEKGTQAVVRIPLYTGESRPDGTVELRTSSETEQEQRKYHLRAMLVREMRTMPERGDPEDEF